MSFGVVISGILIMATGWWMIDPIVTILIGLVILISAFGILKEAFNILMESVPSSLNYQDILSDMHAYKGVNDVHDLHIWEIGSNIYALSAHVSMHSDSVEECQEIVREVKEMLLEKHNIAHTTLEMEGEPCSPGTCHFD